MKIVVTGATGFIGTQLIPYLRSQGHTVLPLSRTTSSGSINSYESLIEENSKNSDAIIHLAGIAHRIGTDAKEYEQSNLLLTKKLANIAIENRVKRFVFLSTAKVHGEESTKPFSSLSEHNPLDAYSESKSKAEMYLASLESDTMFSALRPPVIYGKNPKANIKKLTERIQAGKPIPLPTQPNIRSFVSINNLNEAINCILSHSSKKYQAYLIDDRQPISTEDFIMQIGKCTDIKPTIIKLPKLCFKTADTFLTTVLQNKSLSPLYQNFEIKCDLLEKETNWQPVDTLNQGLQKMLN